MRQYWILLTLGILMTAGAAAVLLYWEIADSREGEAVRPPASEVVVAVLDEALAAREEAVERISERFEAIDDLKTAQELALRRYRNADHLGRARSLGVGRVSGMAEVERLVEAGRLVRLPDTTAYYYLQEFDYSVGYVTPDLARLLDLIGERLHEELREAGLPLYRYNISSVLRTADNQQALRRVNPNATYGVSTHEFGTTLDIVKHIYDYVPRRDDLSAGTDYPALNRRLDAMQTRMYAALGMRYWRHLEGLLGRVLIDLQNEGLVLVTLEREQPVFHITVGQRISDDS